MKKRIQRADEGKKYRENEDMKRRITDREVEETTREIEAVNTERTLWSCRQV